MKCKKCGKTIRLKDQYCINCGERIVFDFTRIKVIVTISLLFLITLSSFGGITKFKFNNYDTNVFSINQNAFKYFDTLIKVTDDRKNELNYIVHYDDQQDQDPFYDVINTRVTWFSSNNPADILLEETRLSQENYIYFFNGLNYQEYTILYCILIIQCILILGLMVLPIIFILRIIYIYFKKKETTKFRFCKYFAILFSISFVLHYITLKIGPYNTYIGNGMIFYIMFSIIGLFFIYSINYIEKMKNSNNDVLLLKEQHSKFLYNSINQICSIIIVFCLLGSFLSFGTRYAKIYKDDTSVYLTSIGNVSLNDINILLPSVYTSREMTEIYHYLPISGDSYNTEKSILDILPWDGLLLMDVYQTSNLETSLMMFSLVFGLITLCISLFIIIRNVNENSMNVFSKFNKLNIIRAISIAILLFNAITIAIIYKFDSTFRVIYTCSVGLGIIIATIISISIIFVNHFYFNKKHSNLIVDEV